MRYTLLLVSILATIVAVQPVTASPADWPEANPFNAFEAGEEKRIWDKPGNLVTEAKSWALSRSTLTIYEDRGGLLSLTNTGPDSRSVTFYFNVTTETTDNGIKFEVLPGMTGMWEEAFLNLVPAQTPQPDTFTTRPVPARLLQVMPPIGGSITKSEKGTTLSLIAGGPGLNGVITFAVKSVKTFSNVRLKARVVTIYGLKVNGAMWATRDEPNGFYFWRPGMPEAEFRAKKITF